MLKESVDRGPRARCVRASIAQPGVAGLLALSLCAAGIALAAPQGPDPTEEPAPIPAWIQRPVALPPATRVAATNLTWADGPARRFSWRPGRNWRAVPETAVTGWLVRPGDRRPIQQTRLRLEEVRQGKSRVLAWLQHTANTEISILAPGDPRLSTIGPAVDDSLRPWPNACSILPYELDRAIDLNRNGRTELAVTASASLPDPAASRILIVEADKEGRPRIVPTSEFVGTVRFEEGIITSITFPSGSADPVLEGEFLPLYNCRFLARLEIRGAEACRSCCMVPMLLRRDKDGLFRPVFDRASQAGLLSRLRADLDVVQLGGRGPLSPPEEAALGRAAAFFYLTGTGAGTRAELTKALGSRASLPQTVQLLGRLDRFFLRDGG